MIRVVLELRKCRGTRKKCRETRDYDDMSDKVGYWLMVSAILAMNISKNLDRVDECSSAVTINHDCMIAMRALEVQL